MGNSRKQHNVKSILLMRLHPGVVKICRSSRICFWLCTILLIVTYLSQIDDRRNTLQTTLHLDHTQVGMLREHGMVGLGYYQSRYYAKYLKPTLIWDL